MKKHLLLILLIVLPFVKANANTNYATTRIIIKFKQVVQFPNQDNNQNYFVTGINGIDALNEKYNCIRFEKLGKGEKQMNNPLYVIHFKSDINIEEAVNNYQLTGELEYAEPDYKGEGGGVIPNDQYFFRQWSLVNKIGRAHV